MLNHKCDSDFEESLLSAFQPDTEIIENYILPKRRAAPRHGRIHPYFTKRSWNVVSEYIQAFTNKYDTVLDPFCGSGVTAVESLVLRRRSLASDLLPWATWITKMKCVSPVDLMEFADAFKQVEGICKQTIESYYSLSISESNKIITEYPYPRDPIPLSVDQHHVGTVDKLFNARQLASLSLIWHAINDVINTSETSRNLLRLVFSAILARSSLTYWTTQRSYKGEYSGNSGIFTKFKYWLPKEPTDLNVWTSFGNRYKWVENGKKETNKLIGSFYNEKTCVIMTLPAEEIGSWVKEGTVDYVFADPPYGGNIAYSDLSTIWQAWLRLPASDNEKEAIEGGGMKKGRDEYLARLQGSIESIYKVLRRGRWFSLVYMHKDPTLWNSVLTLCRDAGFKYEGGRPQPTGLISYQKAHNQLKTLSGEIIINFEKPFRIAISPKYDEDTLTIPTIENYMIKEASRTIIKNLGASVDEVAFNIITRLIALNGGVLGDPHLFKQAENRVNDLASFMSNHFISGNNGRWFLPNGAGTESELSIQENIRYFIFDFLRGGSASFDDVIYSILNKFTSGRWDSDDQVNNIVPEILSELAVPGDAGMWTLKDMILTQLTLPISDIPKREQPRKARKVVRVEMDREDEAELDGMLAQLSPEKRQALLALSDGSIIAKDDINIDELLEEVAYGYD